MRCLREQFIGVWNSEEEVFRMETSPKGSGECMDQGGAAAHFNMGSPGQDDHGNSPG